MGILRSASVAHSLAWLIIANCRSQSARQRNAQAFAAENFREELETNLRSYVRIVVEKEWPAMAEGKSSADAWDAYNRLWQTYYRFSPQDEDERIWYSQSLTRLNQLGDQRRLRLLSSQSAGLPAVISIRNGLEVEKTEASEVTGRDSYVIAQALYESSGRD